MGMTDQCASLISYPVLADGRYSRAQPGAGRDAEPRRPDVPVMSLGLQQPYQVAEDQVISSGASRHIVACGLAEAPQHGGTSGNGSSRPGSFAGIIQNYAVV